MKIIKEITEEIENLETILLDIASYIRRSGTNPAKFKGKVKRTRCQIQSLKWVIS